MARGDEAVRIAVAVGLREAAVSGVGLSVRPLAEGAAVTHPKNGRALVKVSGEKLSVGGEAVDAGGVALSADGPIRFGELALTGEVEVRRVEGGLAVVNALPLEDYVAAVLGAEMPPSFPPEALKAQAVAARTYALGKKIEAVGEGKEWHLGATVLDQVYKGASGGDERTRAAAQATRGEVLSFDHELIEAYFHSACGGRTERGADALGRDLEYLKSVKCGRCQGAPKASWTVRLGREELARAAGLGGSATAARVVERTLSGRASRLEVEAGGKKAAVTAVALRQALGYERLPSLAFDVAPDGKEGKDLVATGRGSGHGAGLCQWGARGMAQEGKGYRDILGHYYPGAELVKMY
jgi:stage II sporulation protein D